MSEMSPAPLSKKQVRLLPREEFVAYLLKAPVSDASKYLALARYLTRRHDKIEMIASGVVGIILGVWLGGGVWQGSLLIGVLAFCATLLLIFTMHWIRSPSILYQTAVAETRNCESALTTEKAKNALPELIGEIVGWGTRQRFDKATLTSPPGLLVNIRLEFWNARPVITTVKYFYLQVFVESTQKLYTSSYAEEGEMLDESPGSEVKMVDTEMKRVYVNKGDRFPNLFRPPLKAEHNVVQVGQLQFQLEDVNLFNLMNGKMVVAMIDHSGQTHWSIPRVIETAT